MKKNNTPTAKRYTKKVWMVTLFEFEPVWEPAEGGYYGRRNTATTTTKHRTRREAQRTLDEAAKHWGGVSNLTETDGTGLEAYHFSICRRWKAPAVRAYQGYC